MQLLETQRLKLLLFTLELKKVTLVERASVDSPAADSAFFAWLFSQKRS